MFEDIKSVGSFFHCHDKQTHVFLWEVLVAPNSFVLFHLAPLSHALGAYYAEFFRVVSCLTDSGFWRNVSFLVELRVS